MKRKRVLYEQKDDVLNIWISDKHFDYAEDEDGVIIHYSKDHEPVYIEILDASRFLGKEKKVYKKEIMPERTAMPILHQIKVK
ncbi:hypothetical protein A2617_04530 [Candidatus Daviesbacteria bacterium RIFOXYD1_FULL_41_10]|uniref:DUF2283 domain-containing protein n=2 Tax=Candidatus Daviesiibacteriota TaxID=1752718 RepID=A0A1F5N0Z5_9BACT|nr:MAG: hypothetical protein UU67_C0005G0002 [Candidatus Daviesbacteria bacterium GW2011_GWB1_41_5]OGE71297.1 MAG: hypothetical protein A2617_04530 [Candidatus Daviesbacteria bacterium RIFOXYD1_FULL_41_10]